MFGTCLRSWPRRGSLGSHRRLRLCLCLFISRANDGDEDIGQVVFIYVTRGTDNSLINKLAGIRAIRQIIDELNFQLTLFIASVKQVES